MTDLSASRRALLRASLAAGAVAASGTSAATTAPRVPLRRFRGWISRGHGPNRTRLEELTLNPIGGRQVVVRTEAASLCYSNVPTVLGWRPPEDAAVVSAAQRRRREDAESVAMIQGHGGVGIVEQVGPDVRRVKPGDRVCVSGTPQCGVCYQCLRGRSDMCQFLGPAQVTANLTPIARMQDGTPVFGNSEIGGLAELMVTPEEWVIPIKSNAPAAQLGMVCSCVSVAGLGATASQGVVTVAPGATVAVVGCGPLGLSAVQGARIAGATTIIAIDPVRVRREAASKLGATHLLDPNQEGDGLVEKVRAITLRDNPTAWAGGRTTEVLGGAGADLVVEAAGCEWVTPRVERGPDPNGVLPMRQAYDMTCPGGALVTTGLARGNIEFPAGLFAIGGRTHHAGQAGGCSPLRDIPRFVSLMESGRFDAAAMIGAAVPLEKMLTAYEDVAYRTSLFSIMVI